MKMMLNSCSPRTCLLRQKSYEHICSGQSGVVCQQQKRDDGQHSQVNETLLLTTWICPHVLTGQSYLLTYQYVFLE